MSWARIRAVARKEFREYRRNRTILSTMAFGPLIFFIVPLVIVLLLPASAISGIGLPLLYMLFIATIIPSTTAAYSVVGEREQGTLEPVLTTPIRREEFLLGKALAALAPTLVIAYVLLGILLACAELFTQPSMAAALFRSPELLVVLLFTPLLAGWSIWTAIAVSTRARDVRVAQQLASVAGLLPLAFIALTAFDVIHRNLSHWLILGVALLLVDALGFWRVLPALFDRERLVTGTKS